MHSTVLLPHSSVSVRQSLHHVAELLKLDLAIVVLINLFEQLGQNLIVLVADAKSLL